MKTLAKILQTTAKILFTPIMFLLIVLAMIAGLFIRFYIWVWEDK